MEEEVVITHALITTKMGFEAQLNIKMITEVKRLMLPMNLIIVRSLLTATTCLMVC